jgi:hypothetical protein
MDQEHSIAFGPFRLETTPGRMLHELAEALAVLTADRVLVLVLKTCSGVTARRSRPLPPWRSDASRLGCWCWGRIGR